MPDQPPKPRVCCLCGKPLGAFDGLTITAEESADGETLGPLCEACYDRIPKEKPMTDQPEASPQPCCVCSKPLTPGGEDITDSEMCQSCYDEIMREKPPLPQMQRKEQDDTDEKVRVFDSRGECRVSVHYDYVCDNDTGAEEALRIADLIIAAGPMRALLVEFVELVKCGFVENHNNHDDEVGGGDSDYDVDLERMDVLKRRANELLAQTETTDAQD